MANGSENSRYNTVDLNEWAILTGRSLYDLFDGTGTVVIYDHEKCLAYYEADEMKLGIKVGDPIKPGTVTHLALTTGKRASRHVSRESSPFGISYSGLALPIRQDHQIVGVIAMTSPLKNQEALLDAATQLSDASARTVSATSSIAKVTANITDSMERLSGVSNKAQSELKNVHAIIDVIRNISDQTRLLSLNAAIEAARAGESGRGFAVVAEEVRKLAQNTNGNVEDISKKLGDISDTVLSISQEIRALDTMIQNQTTSTQAITTAMDHLEANVRSLEDITKNMMI